MTESDTPTARFTLESLKEKNEIPITRWNSRNTWFVLAMGGLGGLLGKSLGVGPSAIGLCAAIFTYIGYDFVRSTPPYADVVEWIRTNLKYYREPSQYANAAEAHVDTDSTIRAVIETPETTRQLTEIKRLYPPHGIVERSDGSYAKMLRYVPPNMDFSTEEEYMRLMESLAHGFNETVDFDICLHATTRPIDIEAYYDRLAERMEDPDVQNNEIFRAVLQEMKDHRTEMLTKTNTEKTHFYVIVSTTESEVQNEVGGDDDAGDRSRIFKHLGRGSGTDPAEAERQRQYRLKKRLEEKIQTVAAILTERSDQVGEADIEQVSVAEAAAVLESFWTGKIVPLESDHSGESVPMTKTTRGPDSEEIQIKRSDVF